MGQTRRHVNTDRIAREYAQVQFLVPAINQILLWFTEAVHCWATLL